MQLAAAASSAVRAVLAGPARPAWLLGASPAALYLATAGEPGVLAVLAHDAVRLPCGLLLPTTRAELPLTAIGPAAGAVCMVGDGRVSWPGPDGPVVIRAVREWAAPRVGRARPVAGAVRQARAALPEAELMGIGAGVLTGSSEPRPYGLGLAPAADAGALVRGLLGREPALTPAADAGALVRGLLGREPALTPAADAGALVRGLLGSGPGLTPVGDDLLAGLLLGCLAFGLDAASLRDAVEALAPVQTTALSATLLWHAARGECIAEVAALTAALTSSGQAAPAVRQLLKVGHTSGAALAYGLILAAEAG